MIFAELAINELVIGQPLLRGKTKPTTLLDFTSYSILPVILVASSLIYNLSDRFFIIKYALNSLNLKPPSVTVLCVLSSKQNIVVIDG